MKGTLSLEKWFVYKVGIGGNEFGASRTVNGKRESHYLHSHCLQCAKTDVLARHGGRVDLRGWHMSMCGAYLKSMQQVIINEEKEGER